MQSVDTSPPQADGTLHVEHMRTNTPTDQPTPTAPPRQECHMITCPVCFKISHTKSITSGKRLCVFFLKWDYRLGWQLAYIFINNTHYPDCMSACQTWQQLLLSSQYASHCQVWILIISSPLSNCSCLWSPNCSCPQHCPTACGLQLSGWPGSC